MTTLHNHETRAEKDNDLIYHHDVPPSSSLEPILPANMVNKNVPPGLAEPKAALEKSGEAIIFEGLVSWGAREAISKLMACFLAQTTKSDWDPDVYKDQRLNWMEALNDRVLELNSAVSE